MTNYRPVVGRDFRGSDGWLVSATFLAAPRDAEHVPFRGQWAAGLPLNRCVIFP
jgi:hypothetical protein